MSENKCYQTEDGLIWHSRSVAVVHMLLVSINGEWFTLITQRSDKMADFAGKWCLPCGYLDWNETVEDAAIREVYEETGLNLNEFIESNSNSIIFLNDFVELDSNPNSYRQNISLKFLSALDLKELPLVKNSNETSEVIWANKESLSLKDFAFNHYDFILSMFNRLEEYGL